MPSDWSICPFIGQHALWLVNMPFHWSICPLIGQIGFWLVKLASDWSKLSNWLLSDWSNWNLVGQICLWLVKLVVLPSDWSNWLLIGQIALWLVKLNCCNSSTHLPGSALSVARFKQQLHSSYSRQQYMIDRSERFKILFKRAEVLAMHYLH